MTKQEALQKIEELRKFVDELDKQESVYVPVHGDKVLSPFGDERIVISIKRIREIIIGTNYIVLDKLGDITNFFNNISDMGACYTKVKNVFKD